MSVEAVGSPYPLYSKSFTVHRLAPLFHDNTALDNANLRIYASQFRDILIGEVLRGVQIGLATENDPVGRIGALSSVHWSLFRDDEGWQSAPGEADVAGDDSVTESIGILVEINYEKQSYYAILLKDVGKAGLDNITGFSHYPLLLIRMPASLKEVFIGFLTSTFDTRVSILKLPSSFLMGTAEKYLLNITTADDAPLESDKAIRILRTVVKDILIALSFDIPSVSASLKTVEFTISKEDSWRMITSGRKLLQSEADQQNNDAQKSRPFTKSLAYYINAHLGLKLDNAHVQISRVACAAFVIGMEGKIKLSAPLTGDDMEGIQVRATKEFLNSLIALAASGKLATRIEKS